MVGLKTFWITICALFLFAACVPQTKQTECGSNEAFNASLRTCVPVVGGPSSFINVSSYSPAFTQTRYKDDATTLTFTIAVSNPYNQSYSVEWERVFNAGPVTMCSNALSCSFPASLLGNVLGEIGTHILTAKIKDANGAVVDSHSFELKINDLPRPVINTATLIPASYAFDAYPSDPRIQFSFTIKNNNATIAASDNYRTVWTIQKNGTTLYTESDTFTTFSPTGTNNAYLGTSPTPYFNPTTLGVGSYIVRAVVQNDVPGEVVAEHQWNVIIKQPDLANVTNISIPAPGVTITAHHNVDYNDFPALSWIYSTPVTQPNFCVTVDDRDGTYASDAKAIQVRWYLDSMGGEICTKTTLDTPGTQTICLNDANVCTGTGAVFDTSLLKFSNASSGVTQTHKVTARLFDEATTYEFERADVIPSNGSYPIEWTVLVKPVNEAPQLAFGSYSTAITGCTSSGAFSRSGCQVDQGADFEVSFTVADDFYSPITNPNEFQWDFYVKYNGANISNAIENTNCTKLFGGAPAPVANTNTYNAGTPYWKCKIAVPDYLSTGPLNPSVGTYQVLLNMQDSGSPVGGAGMVSSSLTWNLTVAEKNAGGITLAPQGNVNTTSHIASGATVLDPGNIATYATENGTVTFNFQVSDPELDNFKYKVSLCTLNTPTTCTSSTALMSLTDFIRSIQGTPDLNPVLFGANSYILPEDLLLQVSPQQDVDTAAGSAKLVYFKAEVIDAPSVVSTPTVTSSRTFSMYVRNYNPAPVINTASASPAVGSTTEVYSGMPFTIDPGPASDASTAPSENSIIYQWYADNGGGFTAITGATSRVLKYTPGNSTTPVTLRVCVGDRPAANPATLAGACYGNWTVNPHKYLENLTAYNMDAGNSVSGEAAVWYDEFNTIPNTQVIYSAYVENNGDSTKEIYVEKTVKNTAGNIVLSTRTVSFNAIPGGTNSNTVQNISITGDDSSIYVAYLASNPSSPATMVPRIRRIEKFKTATGTKTALVHSDRFGFNYVQYNLTEAAANCTVTNGDGVGGAARISCTAGAGTLAVGETITINGIVFTAAAAPASAANEICSAPACTNGNDTAANIAAKINTSAYPELQGITAVASGSTVELYGQYGSDYLDFDGTIAGVPGLVAASNGLGKIFISGGRWNLPFINSSLGGSDQNNITVLSGASTAAVGDPIHMRDTVRRALSTSNDLLDMDRVALFDSKLATSGELIFARISGEVADAGALKLFRYTQTAGVWALTDVSAAPATDRDQMDIFGSTGFASVKLAADAASNSYFYVIAKANSLSGSKYYIGRYSPTFDTGTPLIEYYLSNKVAAGTTAAVMTDALTLYPDIISVPGTPEARIFFHSSGFPRMARWKSDDSVTCNGCESLTGTLDVLTTGKIGVSQVANNITLGAAGNVAGENIRDMVFTVFGTDLSGTDLFKPQLGIINIESEAIQSTTVDGTGLFRPPFVK